MMIINFLNQKLLLFIKEDEKMIKYVLLNIFQNINNFLCFNIDGKGLYYINEFIKVNGYFVNNNLHGQCKIMKHY